MSHELEGKVIDGKYRIEEVWREEPSGFLCAAVHLLRNSGVVLKVLPAGVSGGADFDAEVKMLSAVSHPALLSVRDCSTADDGTRYCVFEPVSGESLAVKVADGRPFTPTEALSIVSQVSEALAQAVEKGFLHGAVEPENIIIGAETDGAMAVTLIGFGNETTSSERIAFAAPETMSGLHSVSPSSDVYALAAILYRLLCGRYPFEGSTVEEIAMSHASIEKLSMPGVPKAIASKLSPILSRALSMNPEMRPTMAEFSDAVHESFETAARPGGSYFKTAAIVMIGIGILSGAMVYLTYIRQADPQTVPMADDQGMPVQPLSPATGMLEANLIGQLPPPVDPTENLTSSDFPGGDNFNPWAGGGPPPGAPSSVQPGGDRIVVEPGNSQFMPPDDQPYYVTPQAPRPTPTPRSNDQLD